MTDSLSPNRRGPRHDGTASICPSIRRRSRHLALPYQVALVLGGVYSNGYGMYALDDPATGLMVGCCGVIHPGGQPEAEIKYAFLREHWGKGLASEVVPALLQYGYEEHGLGRIIATVDPENLVSQRTLLKAGARVVQHRAEDNGTTTLVFEWLASSAA
jgi:ribosomal-protein-alanine N-acetyltransferase